MRSRRQLDRLPQVASQYLHREKIELAAHIARDAARKFGAKGRVHFNVGGSQAIEDSLKLVRNFKKGKSLMFAFEGGYHGRTLGASAITSSYRYRRRYGHFGDRAHFVPFPYHFRGPKGMSKEEYGHHCVQQFERLFESEYNGVWDPKAGEAEYAAFYVEPIQGTGGYIIPPRELFRRAEEACSTSTASCWWSTRSRWASIAPASCGRSSTSACSPTSSCSARRSPTVSIRWPASGRARS